jgi:hypothetical protein
MSTGLPASGVLSLGDISVEVLKSNTAQTSLNDTNIRTLTGKTTALSQIAVSDAYSKRWVTPGSAAFSYTGAVQTWSIQRYQSLTVTIYASGGGPTGGCGNDGFVYGYCGGAGTNGGEANVSGPNMTTEIAYGGTGSAAGGDGYCPPSGNGGSGTGGTVTVGGGAAGGVGCNYGGAGGRVTKTWTWTDADSPGYTSSVFDGGTLSISIGAPGVSGSGGESASPGTNGTAGNVAISWT